VAFIRTLARGIRISPTWGLEVSTLSEVFNHTSENRICQTEIMESYDHKHQDLGEKDARAGVAKMASEIAQAIFREMSQQGSVFSDAGFNSLVATYFGEAHQAINKFNALAKINDLSYDWKAEIAAVDVFVHSLREAIQAFVQDPLGVPSLPAWISVRSVIPDFSDRMQQTVEADNQRGARFLS
jgi:glucosyl-3-phosphoglycerate synthase